MLNGKKSWLRRVIYYSTELLVTDWLFIVRGKREETLSTLALSPFLLLLWLLSFPLNLSKAFENVSQDPSGIGKREGTIWCLPSVERWEKSRLFEGFLE